MQLQRVVGLVEEDEYGVAPVVGAPDFHIEVTDSSIPIEGDPLKFESGLSRDLTLVRQGRYQPKPKFGGAVDLKTIGHFLKGALGSYVFTEGDRPGETNIHEFYGGNNMLLPSYTVYGHFDLFIKEVTGFLIQSLSMEVSNEWMKLSVKGLASVDSKTDGVPEPTALKLLTGLIPLAFYDISLEFDDEIPPGIVSSLKWEINNDIKSDDATGIGSRYLLRKPPAGKRGNKLEMEVSLEPETLKYIEMFEYGEEGANSPQDCIMTTVPLSIVLQACENPDEKLTINFPDNLCKVEYSASGTDAIKLKISMDSLATTQILLNDGITSVLSAVVCTLENYVPELKPGGINMLDPLPVAAFSADVTTGTAPLTVQFTDASIGEDLIYDWDFGDEGSSELASPEHIYSSAGTYTVTLTVSNENGEDVEEKVDYITVSE